MYAAVSAYTWLRLPGSVQFRLEHMYRVLCLHWPKFPGNVELRLEHMYLFSDCASTENELLELWCSGSKKENEDAPIAQRMPK